jgi:tRNA(His) 5'-end guanylyltransferase
MSKDSLGDRMKSYEDSYRISVPGRMPVILRIDGKAFHTYTKGLTRPVDHNLHGAMNETAQYLCRNIQGCQVAYVQSDEISLLLNNYKEIDTQPWFENNLQKMVSVSSGMASAVFTSLSGKIFGGTQKLAIFDSRAFILPKEDVNNYFLWRQQDATRNSVQMLARTLYSHKELNNKNNSQLQELCFQKGFNWNDCPTSQKRGRCIVKKEIVKMVNLRPYLDKSGNLVMPSDRAIREAHTVRKVWEVDNEIPIFSDDKSYIDKYVI